MTASIKHHFTSPKADGTHPDMLQPSHWNAEHDLSGIVLSVNGSPPDGSGNVTVTGGTSDHESLSGLQGGTTGQHVHLGNDEYNWLFGQLPGHTYTVPDETPITKATLDTLGHPAWYDILCWNPNDLMLRIDSTAFSAGDTLRLLCMDGSGGAIIDLGVGGVNNWEYNSFTVANESDVGLQGDGKYFVTSNGHTYIYENGGDYLELYIPPGKASWVVTVQSFLNFMRGTLAWSKVDKTGALPGDVGAAPLYHNHQAGLEGEPAITDNGDGTLSIATGECWFYTDATRDTMVLHTLAGGTTLTPTNDVAGYVCADRDANDWAILTDITAIDYLQYVPYFIVFKRTGSNNMHFQKEPLGSHGEVEAHHQRVLSCERYARESGFSQISVDGAMNITSDAGVFWAVNRRYSLPAISAATRQFFNYHSASAWTVASHTAPVINNTQFDNGADLQSLGAGEWVINYVYKGVEDQDHCYTVLSTNYATVDEAKAAGVIGALPELITSHAVLIGRVIVQNGAAVDPANIESAFTSTFAATTPVTAHNDLTGIQGGTTGSQYYHVPASIFSRLTGGSYAGTGFSGTNISGTINSAGVSLSVAAPGGGGNTVTVSGSNGTFQSNGLSFVGSGEVKVYTTAGSSIVVSAPAQTVQPAVSQWIAGSVTQSGSNNQIVFTGSNGISVHGNGSTVSISLQDIHHLDGFAASGNNNGTGFSLMTSGTLGMNFTGNISASQNGNNFTVSVPNQTNQPIYYWAATNNTGSGGASVGSQSTISFGAANGMSLYQTNGSIVGSYTVPAQSADTNKAGIGLQITTTTGSSVLGTHDTTGLTLGIPAFVTTAMVSDAGSRFVSVQSVSTVATAGSQMTGSAGSAGITLAVPAWVTNAAGGGNIVTVSGSNGTIQSNGLSFLGSGAALVYTTTGSQIVVSAPTPINQPIYYAAQTNTSGAVSTVATASTIQFGNSNGMSLYQTNGSIVGSYTAGAGTQVQAYEPWAPITGSSTSSHTTSYYFNRVYLPGDIAISKMNVIKSLSGSAGMGWSTNNASGSCTHGLYHGVTVFKRQDFGANSSNIVSIASASWGLSGHATVSSSSQSFSARYVTDSTVGTSAVWANSQSTNTSWGTQLTGYKLIQIPMVTTLTAGEYWLCHRVSSSNTTAGGSSISGILQHSNFIMTLQGSLSVGLIGVAGAATGSNFGGQGMGAATGTTATMGLNNISTGTQHIFYCNFSNTPVG